MIEKAGKLGKRKALRVTTDTLGEALSLATTSAKAGLACHRRGNSVYLTTGGNGK